MIWQNSQEKQIAELIMYFWKEENYQVIELQEEEDKQVIKKAIGKDKDK